MKEWTIEIYILDQDGKECPARCFTKAQYNLHPSFDNPVQGKMSSRVPGLQASGEADSHGSLPSAPFQVHQRGMG